MSDDLTPAASITLSKASSNAVLVPAAGIVFGGSGANRTVTVTPAAGQSGSAIISISAGDGSSSSSTMFTLTVLPPGSVISTLYSNLADSAPRQIDGQTPSILASTAADATLFAGRSGTGGTVDRCVVFPFQLPDLGATATPFLDATFSFDLVSNDLSPLTCNLDLYGLGVRTVSTVLASDYHSETNTPDANTRLHDDLCTAATAAGIISSSSSALVNYLNAQYANGANAGKWVFLRLSKDTANGTNSKKFLVTSADGASVANGGSPDYTLWPRIGFTATAGNVAPTISDIANRSVAVNSGTEAIPFTIGDSQTALESLILSKASSNPALVPEANITFGGSGANRTIRIIPTGNQLGSATITVTVGDGTATTSDTFILTVTGSPRQTWRFQHFGTTANTGTAADAIDANDDGEINLLEFATGQSPHASTTNSTPAALSGEMLEFTYTRSDAAIADGLLFAAEWSDTLTPGSWSTIGVTEQIISDNGTVQSVKAIIPKGSAGRRFVHLSIVQP